MVACRRCGHENDASAKFCSECGTSLAPAVPPREVRKTVTVVFCDVTGSTALGERLDPESLRNVMSRYFDRMKAVLEAHGGTVEKFIGDAVMAVFGIPVAHEDDAVRAVRAAHEMRLALAELNADLEHEWSVALETRIGVNTGPVVAGDPAAGQALVTGDAVNTAARLEQAAEPGQILIGDETFGLARDAIDAEPVDPLGLKGKAEAVGAYRLLSVRPGVAGHERRLDSPMVGRDRQLRMLVDAFEASAADAACHLFTVLGPAGIGKSRLVREFASSLGEGAQVVSGRCLSYGEGITFWPIAEMAIQAAGIAEADPPDRARASLRTLLGDAPDGDTVAAHLAGLLGLDGAGRVEPPWAVRRLFEALGRRRPLVAVFDDIHWAEPTLLDVIEHVADWSRDVPILLLCMARPELLEDRPGWGGGKRNATSVLLEPLSEREADVLIENLLGHPALTPDIRERIRAAAQGNPLFVEEMLSMLVDDGVLVQKDGEWVATVDLSRVQVPPAISALLASRLDRLSRDERAVLEAASIVGEVFDRSAVEGLLALPLRAALDRRLGTLLLKDVLRASPSDVGAADGYRFRHILLRDATYEAIPKGERADLHERFSDHLRASMGERASEFDEFIGYHLEQASRMRNELGLHDEHTADLARSAFAHLRAAGQRAFQRGDMATASNLLRRASDLLPPDDPDRLLLAWELVYALVEAGAITEARQRADEVIVQAEAVGHETAATYARCVSMYARMVGDPDVNLDEWAAVAARSIAFFEASGDRRGQALAWIVRVYELWFRQQVDRSRVAAERALDHARAAGDHLFETDLQRHLLFCRFLGPAPLTDAIEEAERTLVAARATDNRRLEATARFVLGGLHGFRGAFEDGRRLMADSRAFLRELGLALDYWATAQNAARVERIAGDLDAAAGLLLESVEALESLDEKAFLSTNAAELAAIEVERGNLDEAEHWIQTAERTGSPDDGATQIEIRRARGLLLARRGDPAGAEESLTDALRRVDLTDLSLWRAELRLELARVIAPDRRDEARRLGREASALVEAKAATALEPSIRRFLTELDR